MQPTKPSSGTDPKPEGPKKKAMLNVSEAAEALQLAPEEVQQLARRGILPGTQVRGEWIFPTGMLESWQRTQMKKAEQNAAQRSVLQKISGLNQAKPVANSTESFDLSIIEEFDIPDV